MYEKKILDAIQLLVDNAIDKASYDKTIKCVVSKCVDEKNGKYVVVYQDSSFYAYSNDTTQKYNTGVPVYVLIPGNDKTQTKTIIGSVNKLGSDYITAVEDSKKYDIIGNSVATLASEQGICSYKENGDLLLLYDKSSVQTQLIDLDMTAIDIYIKQAQYLILGGKFRTNLNKEQKLKGKYGLGFDLNFLDNITGETVKRTYLVDINNMTGNPYEYTKASQQNVVFNIDGNNFVDIDKIYLYGYDFPNTSSEQKPNDIFVSDLIINAATALSEEELAGNKLILNTPQGIYFDNNDDSNATRRIETEIRIDNRLVNKDSSSLKYYWFKENYSINSSSLLYNRYGGNGWECLNNKNIVESDEHGNPILIEWLSNQDSYLIAKKDTLARTTDYKCVVVYNNELILTKLFTIYNYSSDFIVTIESDSGTYFSYDNGHPTLTCNVNIEDDYTYNWGVFDNLNNFSSIIETSSDNDEYHQAKDRYDEIQLKLANGTLPLTASLQTEIAELEAILYTYETKMRVEGNTIYNLQLNNITNFSTYVCTVYKNNVYIGKGKIKIENDLNNSDNSYTLIINNRNQIFKYNEDGISPASKSLEMPQEIYPLSFILLDEHGNEIDNRAINLKDIFWTVPTENTMINVSAVHGNPISIDELNKTKTYTEYREFYFGIPTLYNSKNIRNTIELKVRYKNKNIIAKTDLIFLKEGDNGSNGTAFYTRIIPNNINVSPLLQPMVTYDNNNGTYKLNFNPAQANVWFKAQLYRNGEEIFNNSTSGNSTEGNLVTVKWEILKNKYDLTHSDVSNFIVNQNTGVFSYDNLSNVTETKLKNNPANIVKCTLTYNGVDYVALKPIVLVKVNNTSSKSYRAEWESETGFSYAAYSADGRNPIYSNALPFALKIYRTVQGVEEDISLMPTSSLNYTWSAMGAVWDGNDWALENNLTEKNYSIRELKRNEKYFKPADNYNGLSVNNGLKCVITSSGTLLMEIYLPIDFYLNRYGKAALNGWSGNSIEINNEGGFILAPQIGAGKKENDNSYTGIFMGTVIESNGEEKNGLFGYHEGGQTIFLDAEDGSARFGAANQGQIVIDPGLGSAKLYSDDYNIIYSAPSQMVPAQTKYLNGFSYWRRNGNNYTLLRAGKDYQIGETIKSSDYVWAGGSGLEIDLNDPHIRFGSGKFRVDSDGQVYATGFATVEELENGDYNIPGMKKFQLEYPVEDVQFETNVEYYPTESVTRTISCKCSYNEEYTNDYTISLINNSGIPITHDTEHNTDTDGISISIVKGQDGVTAISFTVNANKKIQNTINDYLFRFTYTPTGDYIDKIFGANLIIRGTSISVKGSYDSLQDLLDDVDSGIVTPSKGDAYVINRDLYVYTNDSGGGGSEVGDWENVGQFTGESAKQCIISTTSEAFKSENGGATYSPDNIIITPYFQNVNYSSWAYSTDGGANYDTLGTISGITMDVATKALTITKDCQLFNTNSILVFKCLTDGIIDGKQVFDTRTIMKIKDGVNGVDGYSIWTTTTAPTTPNYTFNISNLIGPTEKTPQIGEAIIRSNRYQYTITSVTSTTVRATTVQDLKGSNGYNSATVNLYGRFDGIPSKPYNEAVTYTFSNGTLSSIPTGWSQSVPNISDGKPLYISSALAYGNGSTVSIGANAWSTPVVIVEDGEDGTSPTFVTCGNEAQTIVCNANGKVSAETYVTIPFTGYVGDSPVACTVTYSTLPSGMTLSANTPASATQEGSLVFKIATAATLGGATNGEIILTFSCNSKTFVKRFSWAKALTGAQGQAGNAGYNTATINLYKRSSSTSSLGVPYTTATVYTFETQTLNPAPSNSWSLSIPDGTAPLYVCSAIAYSNTETDGIAVEDWTSPIKIMQNGTNGTNGTNTATINLYQRKNSSPSAITTAMTYDFTTQTLSPSTALGDWSLAIPADDGNPLYITSVIASSSTSSASIAANKWSTPIKLVENGTDGESIIVNTTTLSYCNSADGETPPSTGWTSSPNPIEGRFLWTRTITTYKLKNSGTSAGSSTSYSVAYIGESGSNIWTTSVAPVSPNYTFTISNLSGPGDGITPVVGDIIVQSYYRYTIASIGETTVLAGNRTSIRGATGAAAYTVSLSNEAHTFAATETHAIGETLVITPTVLKGTAAQTTYTIGSITGTINGKITATISSTTPYTITVIATENLDIENGILTIPITIDNNTFNKTFSWSLAKAGTDGTGITNTEIKYLNDNQGTTPPSDSANWSSSIPTEDVNKRYLWTRTRMTYSDGNVESSYSVSYKGINGTSVTISSQEIKYGYNNDGNDYSDIPATRTSQNPGGWDTSIPDTPDGSYLWTRTKVNYSDGNSTTSYTVSYQSRDGTNATQYYTHIMYATNAQGANISSNPSGKTYIGIRVDEIPTASTTPGDYTWSKFIGDNGTDGFSLWTTTVAPSNNVYTRSQLTGPTSTQVPRVGEVIIRSNRYQYSITNVNGNNITVGSAVDLKGANGTNGTSIVWKGDLSSAPSNPQNLWAYYNTTDKKSYIYNGSQWEIMTTDGTPGAKGQDATQYYYHVVYCNNTSTGAGYAISPNNQIYTGTYVDTSSADASTWSEASTKNVKWNYTKGDAGVDSTNVVCGNEAETIVCNPDGKVKTETTITIPFAGYVGSNRAACTVTYSTLPSGMSLVSNTAATAGSSGNDGSLVLKAAAAATLGNTDTGVITLTFTCNSKTFVKKFTWAKAIAGENGSNIWTTTTAPTTPDYTFNINNLVGPKEGITPMIGDIIVYSYYRYTIASISSTTVLANNRTSIRGSTGAGSKWYTGTGITGTSTTATIFPNSGVSSAIVGDMYLNTNTQNTYRCTTAGAPSAAKWVYESNIQGEDGSRGTGIWNTSAFPHWDAEAGTMKFDFSDLSGLSGTPIIGDIIIATRYKYVVEDLDIENQQTISYSRDPIKGEDGKDGNGYVYIVGTQTQSTEAWTGTTTELTEIKAGTQILYKLPYAGNGSNVTLNLTLANGTTTGAKNCYYKYSGTRLTTQYPVNSMIAMIYDGTQWIVVNPYTDNNNYDRIRYNNNIKANGAIANGDIIVGTANGYVKATAGVSFDVNYPILRSAAAIAQGGVSKSAYITMPSTTLRQNKSGIVITPYRTIYLVGTLSGNTFTIDNAVFCEAPTSATNKYFIPIGMSYSEYEIYFEGGIPSIYVYNSQGFVPISNASVTSITPLHYLRVASESTAPTKPTSHVTQSGDVQSQWTTAIPTYDTGATYYICNEKLYADGHYEWTNVIYDNGINDAFYKYEEVWTELLNLQKTVDFTKTDNFIDQIVLNDAYKGSIHKISIWQNTKNNFKLTLPSSSLYPNSSLRPVSPILVVDNTIKYQVDIDYLNWLNADVYDEFVYEDGLCKIIRRVNEAGTAALDTPIEEPRENVIRLTEGGTNPNAIEINKSSTIKLEGFSNLKYSASWLLENEFTDTFTTDVNLISKINATPGKIAIAANKISLEGLVTANENFKVLKDGSIRTKNGTFSGNIYFENGGKVIGGDGLLTNLQFNSMGPINGWSLLGYGASYSGGLRFYYNYVTIDCFIPENFTIEKAYITLDTSPVKTWNENNVDIIGNSRNLKLYKNTTAITNNFIYAYGVASDYWYENGNMNLVEVPDAFSSYPYTPSATTPGNVDSITTIDLAPLDLFVKGQRNQFIIRTSELLPGNITNCVTLTGLGKAFLTIIGYMSKEGEGE